ncbi:DUF6207 family protein [Streptomyces sp. NPDC004069]
MAVPGLAVVEVAAADDETTFGTVDEQRQGNSGAPHRRPQTGLQSPSVTGR